ncbi:MAG: ATPase [Dehalococcoidia bacterium]|nr:ATPase [Dehalococcoidia bacterium]
MLADPVSLATLGGGIALAGGVVGSSLGISNAASAGIATLSKKPGQLRNVIILSSVPMSQTFYGLIMMILILTTVIPKIAAMPDAGGSGFAVLACSIVVGFSGAFSGAYKGSVLAAGIAYLPKTEGKILTSSLMLAVFVELIAVLGLVFSIMALSMLGLM